MPDNINVVIVNGDAEARKGISDIISSINDLVIADETDSGEQGLSIIEKLNPDVIVTGDFIRGISGYDFSEAITALYPFQSIIMVAKNVDENVYKSAMRAGIKEVIGFPLDHAVLGDAIYRVYDIKKKH